MKIDFTNTRVYDAFTACFQVFTVIIHYMMVLLWIQTPCGRWVYQCLKRNFRTHIPNTPTPPKKTIKFPIITLYHIVILHFVLHYFVIVQSIAIFFFIVNIYSITYYYLMLHSHGVIILYLHSPCRFFIVLCSIPWNFTYYYNHSISFINSVPFQS